MTNSNTKFKVRIVTEFEISSDDIRNATKDNHIQWEDKIDKKWIEECAFEVIQDAEEALRVNIEKGKRSNDQDGMWDGLGHLLNTDALFLRRIVENLNVEVTNPEPTYTKSELEQKLNEYRYFVQSSNLSIEQLKRFIEENLNETNNGNRK